MTTPRKFEIMCSPELMKKIEEHCFSSTKIEVGGFLVGVVQDGKSTVTHVLKARHTANTQSQLTFTNKTWETAFSEMSEISPDAQLIGWFHSHPNFGVFLSDYDKFIQNEFFNKDGMITIVVDPINGKRGWFISIDKDVRPYADEEDTEMERLHKQKDDSPSSEGGIELKSTSPASGLSTGKTVAIAALFSLFSLLGSFAISGGQGGSIDKEGLQNQIDVLQIQIANLQQQLNPETTVEEKAPEVKPSAPKVRASSASTPTQSKTKQTTKSIAGTSCDKEGASRIENGKTFKCTKNNGMLIWQLKPALKSPATTPTPKQSPTSDSVSGPQSPSDPKPEQSDSVQKDN